MITLRSCFCLLLSGLCLVGLADNQTGPTNQRPNKDSTTITPPKPKAPNAFTVASPVVKDGGNLPAEFTGDGESASPPLTWTNIPKGTQSFALIMHHLDPEGKTKIYWVLYNIDPTVTSLAKNSKDVGTMGQSTVHNRVEYAPPHSKGPGAKKYIITLYALSSKLDLKSNGSQPVTADDLTAAMKGKILAQDDLNVIYTRPAGSTGDDAKPARQGGRPNNGPGPGPGTPPAK
jgi:Raf kinase inhibitor-like YbhB/YbcL family protein